MEILVNYKPLQELEGEVLKIKIEDFGYIFNSGFVAVAPYGTQFINPVILKEGNKIYELADVQEMLNNTKVVYITLNADNKLVLSTERTDLFIRLPRDYDVNLIEEFVFKSGEIYIKEYEVVDNG